MVTTELLMSIPGWSANGALRASHHNVNARTLGCVLHKTGEAMARLGVCFGARCSSTANEVPVSQNRPNSGLFQRDCGHVLSHFSRVLRYFMLGYFSAVVMMPW